MRTFVAIEIDTQNILQKIKSLQESISFKAKHIRIDQIHFTLQFLGELENSKVEEVKKALQQIHFSKFELSVIGSGAFPNTKNPRIVWVGVDNIGTRKLVSLAKNVNSVLKPVGFIVDKPFKPHLTVLRIKTKVGDITNELLKFKNVEFGKQMVSKIILKESVLSHDGPEYSNLVEVSST